MPVTELNHYFVRTNDLERSRRFYCEALGFAEFKLFQMFVEDPDGLTLELNFHGIADEPAWGAGSENYAAMPRVAESAR